MATKQVVITIDDEAGEVRAVYDDALQPIFEEVGEVQVCRASDVEPMKRTNGWSEPLKQTGEWKAESRDGMFDYVAATRKECIEKEIEYLNEEVLPSKERTDSILNG